MHTQSRYGKEHADAPGHALERLLGDTAVELQTALAEYGEHDARTQAVLQVSHLEDDAPMCNCHFLKRQSDAKLLLCAEC
jgi:hypothetical protein